MKTSKLVPAGCTIAKCCLTCEHVLDVPDWDSDCDYYCQFQKTKTGRLSQSEDRRVYSHWCCPKWKIGPDYKEFKDKP